MILQLMEPPLYKGTGGSGGRGLKFPQEGGWLKIF